MTATNPLSEKLYGLIIVIVFSIILLVDFVLPKEVEVSALYAIPLMVSTFLVSRVRVTIIMLLLAVGFMVVGWYLTEADLFSSWYGVVNRMVSVVLIFSIALFGVAFSRLQSESIERERQLGTAMDTSPNGIFLVNSQGRIIYNNQQAERLFGYNSIDFESMQIEDLIPNRYAKNHKILREQYAKDPRSRSMGIGRELYGLQRSGSEFPIEVGLASFVSKDESIVQATVVDVSERVERERQLFRKNDEISQLVNVVAHDIQAPVRHIIGYLQASQGYAEDQRVVKAFDQISKSANRIRELIAGLLDFAKAGSKELNLSEFELSEVVNQVFELNEIEIEQKNVSVEVGELPRINADRSLVEQLFQNLIENSLKYRDASRSLEVKVYSTRDARGVKVWVADNGIGIDEKYFEDIFRALRRLHSDSDYSGTGIGLSICKKIVDLHGWEIGVESNIGEGTRFYIGLG